MSHGSPWLQPIKSTCGGNRGQCRLSLTANYSKSWAILYSWENGIKVKKGRGMEPDDLLCSRNARPQKALVGRAQWKINQPPSLKR
jgi:hypothetical protein